MPAVVKVVLNVPTPLTRTWLAGSTAPPSLLANVTVPVYVGAVLPNGSWAVTVKPNPAPAVAVEGPLTENLLAAAALTIMLGPRPDATPVPKAVMNPLVVACVSVAWNTPTPPVKVAVLGTKPAPVSPEALNDTVPV